LLVFDLLGLGCPDSSAAKSGLPDEIKFISCSSSLMMEMVSQILSTIHFREKINLTVFQILVVTN